MTTVHSQCIECRHLQQGREDWTCAAFPTGIPNNVADTTLDHRQEVEGDGGVRWEPRFADSVHPLAPERSG